jgi:hypothetical protein
LSALRNPHVPPPAKTLAEGAAAIDKGKALGAKTKRERDYIDALAVFYTDHDKLDHRTRVQAYLKAMQAVAQRYPKDDEAQIAYAITLNVAASPADKTYANQLEGAKLLEPIFKRKPQHPGVAHYLMDCARPSDTPRSQQPHRTPSTCRRTSTRVSDIGRIRLHRTLRPPVSRRRARRATISCMRWTILSTRICSWPRTRRHAP